MEGPSSGVPAISDVPPTVPTVGQGWDSEKYPRDSGQGSARTRKDRPRRMFHRRLLYRGEKRGLGVGKTKRGKGTKLMAIADAHGIPIAIHTTSASPHEVTLVEETLEQNLLTDAPERLIGDGAYDSDPLDDRLKEAGIKLIAPHRRNRVSPPTQDGREFRRYKRRWKIERLFAWLHNYRRLVIHWAYKLENFTGFLNLGCILIVLRYL